MKKVKQYGEEIVASLEDVVVTSTWTDDHILCAQADVTLSGETYEGMEFLWVGHEGVAALEYFESKKAHEGLIMLFAGVVESGVEMGLELLEIGRDEFEADQIKEIETALKIAGIELTEEALNAVDCTWQ